MSYEAKILADSISSGVRLTTLQVTFPRIVLAEFNTHRTFSRNSASSRAIPVERRIQAVLDDPFFPEAFAANKAGMQGGEELLEGDQLEARSAWEHAKNSSIVDARRLAAIGVHKHWANRLIEPHSWHTVICTATEWENFFALRDNVMAAPEMQTIARLMRSAMALSKPVERGPGGWHLPLVDEEMGDLRWAQTKAPDDPGALLAKVSSARCARVSYLTHDGKRDVEADLALHDKLRTSGHMSPFEHAARVVDMPTRHDHLWLGRGDFPWWCPLCDAHSDARVQNGQCAPIFIGNFRAPFWQYRKTLPNEAVFRG